MSATYQDSGALSLEAAVEQYFTQLNPIAQRIAQDIRETKSKYGQLWCTLNLHEQDEVINETLIKPEISLRYFDNFVSSSSSLSSTSSSSSAQLSSPCTDLVLCRLTHEIEKKSASTDSLLKKPITQLALPRAARSVQQSCVKSATLQTKSKSLDFRNYYAFDGRNLKTFAHQRVAQKIIQDYTTLGGTNGGYCDEHSKPFSYRTKSQINLYKLDNADHNNKKTATHFAPNDYADLEDDGDQICLLSSSHTSKEICDDVEDESVSIQNTASYKKLQHEFKINLSNHQFEKKQDAAVADNNKTTHYNRFDNANNFLTPMVVNPPKMCVDKTLNISNNNSNTKNEIILKASFIDASAMRAATSTFSAITYATYTDGYFEHEESSNLMQSCGNSGVLTASSSSAATSDDDRDDDYDDEKTLCEDVKLLDNDVNLRRGFDFLNNW